MPDPLQSIVQKMIDAGESEENIALVIQSQSSVVPIGSMARGLSEPHTLSDSSTPDWKEKLASVMEPLAHPKTASDILALMIPGGAGGLTDRVIRLAGKLPLARMGLGAAGAAYGGATAPTSATPWQTAQRAATYGVAGAMAPTAIRFLPASARGAAESFITKASELHNPLTVEGREAMRTAASQRFNELPLAQQMADLPSTPAPVRFGTAPPVAVKPLPTPAEKAADIVKAREATGVVAKDPSYRTSRSALGESETIRYGKPEPTFEEQLAAKGKELGPDGKARKIQAPQAIGFQGRPSVSTTRPAPLGMTDPRFTPAGDEAAFNAPRIAQPPQPMVSQAEYQAARTSGQIHDDVTPTEYARMVQTGEIRRPLSLPTTPPIRIAPTTLKKLNVPVEKPATQPGAAKAPDPPYEVEATRLRQVGVGIPREPTKLVLTPADALAEAQTKRAYKPSASVQGMKAAARVPRGEQEAALARQGFTPMEIALIMQSVFR